MSVNRHLIIDMHTHLSKFEHLADRSFAQIRDALLSDMRSNGVALSMLMPDSEHDTLVSDLDTTLELARDCPALRVLGTVFVMTVTRPDVDRLDVLASDGAIVGVKLYPGFEEFYPSDAACEPIYQLCIRHDIPLVFHSGEALSQVGFSKWNHPYEIAKVAAANPTLRIVIAHFAEPHLEACREVVLSHPNVHADISGLADAEVIGMCGKEAIRANLDAVAVQQPEKVLYATDWPLCDVGSHLRLVEGLPISEDARALILGGNAMRVFKLDPKVASIHGGVDGNPM